jgi:hypothetical protein
MNLAFVAKRKILSIFLLLACIFTSLFLMNRLSTIEGMTTKNVVSKMNDILNDTSHTTSDKIAALKSIVPFMDNITDQNPYTSILLDTSKSQDTQLSDIQNLINTSINDNPIKK